MLLVSSHILVLEESDSSEMTSDSVDPKLKSPFSILVSVMVEVLSPYEFFT